VDPITGMVIYITNPDNRTNVEFALHALDPEMRQVLIKVVFLEVTWNKGLDIGAEGGISHRFSGNQMGSFSNLLGLASEGITPTSGINTMFGASLATFTGSDFSVFVRAIEENGKVEVLSRPSVLARHAQPASILIGQSVPLITGVNFGTLGQVTSVITYTSVGIQLVVTPFIHPNKNVEMILNPTISEVAAQSTLISASTNGNFSTPYINSRSANTVVVVPSGQTIVIGGLMQDSKTTTQNGIPILQKIPILGAAFRHKVNATVKTELMIFVTPTVINTKEDLAAMSVDETSRAPLSSKSFNQRTRADYLDPESPTVPGGAPSRVVQPAPPPTPQTGSAE
jgi:general secretion pathway protein D